MNGYDVIAEELSNEELKRSKNVQTGIQLFININSNCNDFCIPNMPSIIN